MKKDLIVKIIGQEFQTTDVEELNKILKAKNVAPVKFRITGKNIGYLGYTGLVKAVALEGVKVFEANKVSLIKFEDIEKIEKAKPKVPRTAPPKKEVPVKVKKAVVSKGKNEIAKETGKKETSKKFSSDDDDTKSEKFRKTPAGKQGSSFIPKSRK